MMGEGYHNYHHTFPWDYRASELGNYAFNWTVLLIDFFAKIGWAYELKIVPEYTIKKRAFKTGDGSHNIWGWGDMDQTKEETEEAVILYNET